MCRSIKGFIFNFCLFLLLSHFVSSSRILHLYTHLLAFSLNFRRSSKGKTKHITVANTYFPPRDTMMSPHTHHIVAPGFVERPRRSDCTAGQMDGEAGWWTTSGNIGLPPLARAMGVGRQQQQCRHITTPWTQPSDTVYDTTRHQHTRLNTHMRRERTLNTLVLTY